MWNDWMREGARTRTPERDLDSEPRELGEPREVCDLERLPKEERKRTKKTAGQETNTRDSRSMLSKRNARWWYGSQLSGEHVEERASGLAYFADNQAVHAEAVRFPSREVGSHRCAGCEGQADFLTNELNLNVMIKYCSWESVESAECQQWRSKGCKVKCDLDFRN